MPLAVLLPVVVLLVSIARLSARRRTVRFLGRRASAEVRGARRRSLATDVCLLSALCSIAVALLGPRIVERSVVFASSRFDLVLLLDVSKSMLARDLAPSRRDEVEHRQAQGTGGKPGVTPGMTT